nr:hypothetical protein [Tanacetum cinerariifolium]
MPSGESPIGGANINSSMVLLSTESLLAMCIPSVESSLSLNSRLHRGYVTASCSRKADKSDSQRTLCFQRLSSNVYKKHRNPKACGRPLTRCRKLPEEAQPNKARYILLLKRKEAYIAYSNPRGFIYQNKDKQNRLMRIDELLKFSDAALIDVRTALDDRLKGIWMKYLPQSIWRKSNKDRAAAMIQAIDKRLKTRRIMRSLKRFVGGRLYKGDFRMLKGPYDLSYVVLIFQRVKLV